jgi:hypothetical protein
VTSDIENLKFNTAISALMVFNNLAIKKGRVTRTRQKLLPKYFHRLPRTWVKNYGGYMARQQYFGL